MANISRRERLARQFGAEVRERRIRNGWTLEDIKRKTSLDMGNLSKIERGMIIPRLDNAIRIAKAFNTTLDEITAHLE
jgi:transcriptional regulator with XRE-family HTH domain